MATRTELLRVLRKRYKSCGREEKTRVLDEFVAVTAYHRKHAIRLLNQTASEEKQREVRKVYDEAVRQALVVLWEASDRMCGKRLKVMVPVLIESLEHHGHLELDAVTLPWFPGPNAKQVREDRWRRRRDDGSTAASSRPRRSSWSWSRG